MVPNVGLVGQRVGRWAVAGLVAGVVLGSVASPGEAQRKAKKPQRPRRETNASRQARIDRTIQDTYSHRYEVIGGGGYLRWRSGPYTKKNNEISWDATLDYYLTPKLAIVGDAQGSFGNAHQRLLPGLAFPQIPNPQINEYFFTGGVSYRFYAKEKVALSAQGTGGVADGIFSGGAKGLTGPQVGLWNDGFVPAFKISVNADYNLFPNLGVRFSPTYVGTTFGSTVQNNLGFNAGVLYRFGRQK